MSEREYQEGVAERLRGLYSEVKVQWYPFRRLGRDIYAPRIDVAVGPFATEDRRYGDEYDSMLEGRRNFIECLIEMHNQNVGGVRDRVSFESIAHFNQNARCLLGIEIEDKGSRKHCLGDLINASALGRIGILVACNETILKAFLRQRVYLRFLGDVEKNTFKTTNALVLTVAQFNECLSHANRR